MLGKQISKEVAEIAGIFTADGCLQPKYLCIWGHISEDKPYFDLTLKKLFKKAFKLDINVHEKRSNSVYGFYLCDKKVINYFKNYLGFPIGSKTYTVRVPAKIRNSNSKKVITSFIRGFCDGDGCLSFDKRRGNYSNILKVLHTYPRIQLKSVSQRLIEDISRMLKFLGIKHSLYRIRSNKLSERDSFNIQILGKENLQKWIKIIGFSNPVHQTKYEIFKKYAFVPVKINLNQRIKILAGELDPWLFYPSWTRSAAWIAQSAKNWRYCLLTH